MGKWKAMGPIVLALLIAVTASTFLYKWMKTQTTPQKVLKVKTKAMRVAVAEVDLPWGTKLKPEMVKFVPFFEESLPPGSFSDPEKLTGRVVITPLKRKELILESRLASKSVTRGGVSAIIKPGKRAMAVAGNKILGISGLICPGDHVDIMIMTTDPKTKEKINKTIFENMRVLATGTQLGKNKDGKPAPVDIYTLEVTPEEGERLSLASSQGKLRFALRNALDTETVLTTGATFPQTLAAYRPVEPPKKAVSKGRRVASKKRVRRSTHNIEIIKGIQKSKKVMKDA